MTKRRRAELPSERSGIYPGTFDPITFGHVDIIRRALKLVDRPVIAVAPNDGKEPFFPVGERIEMVRQEVEPLARDAGVAIQVEPLDGLLMHFAEEAGASIIIRGLRAVSDFEYEFQMAGMNARLAPKVETVFLMASESHQFVSSRFVKEIAQLGGDVSSFVSSNVLVHFDRLLAGKGGKRAALGPK